MAGSVVPGLCASALFLLLLAGRTGPVWATSEPGKCTVDVNSQSLKDKQLFSICRKTLFDSSSVHLRVMSHDCLKSPVQLNVSWYLRSYHCYNEIFTITEENAASYFGSKSVVEKGGSGFYVQHDYPTVDCQTMDQYMFGLDPADVGKPPVRLQQLQQLQNSTVRRRRDAADSKPKPVAVGGATNKSSDHSSSNLVAKTWEDGPYVFILRVQVVSLTSEDDWRIQLQISMEGPHGYISATEWPLMVFYMVMCIAYVLMAMLWLVLSSCYWRDLLRIQFWIGGVIFLGMLEKAVYYAEFQSIRYDGVSVRGAVVFAEVLSAVKRTLARVLVIVASLGYGIVKPRLGALMHRVVAVGLLYLVFSIMEGILRVNMNRGNTNQTLFLCDVVLAFIDSCIVWWIFMSLTQTMKLLKLRRNVVKLSLFRHFTNTLIFAVVASVIFIIWRTKTFTMSECWSDWREVWIQDAFWSFLFFILLLVIMFLWRPSANNQRYAFSPLVDEESEDEEKEPMMNEAFEGMKMRGTKNETNGAAKANKVDEDLKWVEENIPSSMADVALPPLLDSDEEKQTTKFEMSKMD